jgi:type I restriction enzyme M protein
MNSSTTQLLEKLWTASSPALKVVDPFEFRSHLLALFFLKALNDLTPGLGKEEPLIACLLTWAGTKIIIPPEAFFARLKRLESDTDPAPHIHNALQELSKVNPQLFAQWFEQLDFSATGPLGKLPDSSKFLHQLLADFPTITQAHPDDSSPLPPIGQLYDALLVRFAHECGSRGTTFYAPTELTQLVAALLAPAADATIFAPDSGSGSFLLPLTPPDPQAKIHLIGTESHPATWALGQMRLFLHGQVHASVYCRQLHPKFPLPSTFDFIIANPFFSSANWNVSLPASVRFSQPRRGKVPRRNMGFQYVEQLADQLQETGKMAVLLPLGALFWDNQEYSARKRVIDNNWLEAIIALPPHLFITTNYAFALLLFNRAKPTHDILLIDASQQYDAAQDYKRRRLNLLKSSALAAVTELYQKFAPVTGQAVRITLAQVQQQKYDLSLQHYFPPPAQQEIDPSDIQQKIAQLATDLAVVRQELRLVLAEIGIHVPSFAPPVTED